MAVLARSSDFGFLSRFTVSLFTVTRNEGQFAHPMIVCFVFYAAHADGELFFGLFWPFYGVSAHFYKKRTPGGTSLG